MALKYINIDKKNTKLKNGIEMIDFLCKTFQIPKDFTFTLTEITSDYIARPDLVSFALYSTTDYADILCKLNGISNPMELNVGDILICPELNYILSFYVIENSLYNTSATDNLDDKGKAIQKKKNEKRKANEQVIGDSNFKIDHKNKIIIY